MSCFICNDNTISRIVCYCVWHQKDVGWGTDIVPFRHLPACKEEQALGERLRKMNEQAYTQRYSGKYSMNLPPYTYTHQTTNIYQVLKDIHCYLYQCSEGTIPKKKLYKQLRELQEAIESHIIHRLPEYEKAGWNNEPGSE